MKIHIQVDRDIQSGLTFPLYTIIFSSILLVIVIMSMNINGPNKFTFQAESLKYVEYISIISNIPKSHLEGINLIFMDDEGMSKGNNKIYGEYFYVGNPGTIKIYDNGYMNPETVYHEVGHHVWYKIFNNTQRSHYKQIWADLSLYVCEYGSTEPEEGFAVTYACIIQGIGSYKFYDLENDRIIYHNNISCLNMISEEERHFFRDNVFTLE